MRIRGYVDVLVTTFLYSNKCAKTLMTTTCCAGSSCDAAAPLPWLSRPSSPPRHAIFRLSAGEIHLYMISSLYRRCRKTLKVELKRMKNSGELSTWSAYWRFPAAESVRGSMSTVPVCPST